MLTFGGSTVSPAAWRQEETAPPAGEVAYVSGLRIITSDQGGTPQILKKKARGNVPRNNCINPGRYGIFHLLLSTFRVAKPSTLKPNLGQQEIVSAVHHEINHLISSTPSATLG